LKALTNAKNLVKGKEASADNFPKDGIKSNPKGKRPFPHGLGYRKNSGEKLQIVDNVFLQYYIGMWGMTDETKGAEHGKLFRGLHWEDTPNQSYG